MFLLAIITLPVVIADVDDNGCGVSPRALMCHVACCIQNKAEVDSRCVYPTAPTNLSLTHKAEMTLNIL